MSRNQASLRSPADDPTPSSRLWGFDILILSLPAVLAVLLALASASLWHPLAIRHSRVWGDLLVVCSQNGALFSSSAYALASVVSILARLRHVRLLVSMFILCSALFVTTGTRTWLRALGSKEFRASAVQSQSEAEASFRAITQSRPRALSSSVLYPHLLTFDFRKLGEALDIRPLMRRSGGPPVVGLAPAPAPAASVSSDVSVGLDLDSKIRLTLSVTSPRPLIDTYPPQWVVEGMSPYGRHHKARPTSRRPRR